MTGSERDLPAGATPDPSPHPLDNPVHAALTGPHARLAERLAGAARYPVDVAPFVGLPVRPAPQDWDALGTLAGPGAIVVLTGPDLVPPAGWEVVTGIPGVQLVDAGVAAAPDDEAVTLTAADVPEMLALVERTRPGPFLPRTIELGRYLGIRRNGQLVAMAGERMRPPAWTEISAVCTDATQRGEGLATRLVLAVAHGIRARGDTAFLHAAASNTGAIDLYQALGFRLRRTVTFSGVRVPLDVP